MQLDDKAPFSWYPGHMLKAEREIRNKLSLVDLLIEVVDARAPVSTRNYRSEPLLKQKPSLLALNKADLADPACTERWLGHFHETKTFAITLSKSDKNTVGKLKRGLFRKIVIACRV